MNGKRCAIFLEDGYFVRAYVNKLCGVVVVEEHSRFLIREVRIFGSHSEAKRELTKWLPAWPDAKIVDEAEL